MDNKRSQLAQTIKTLYNATDDEVERIIEIMESESYKRADKDEGFLDCDEARPLRLQLEYSRVQSALRKHNVEKTIVVFGGTQVTDKKQADQRYIKAQQALQESPESEELQFDLNVAQRIVDKAKYYDQARTFGSLVAKYSKNHAQKTIHVVTGGGPGIMEAGNKGAYEGGEKSIGLNIDLPFEQFPNAYIDPELCFSFRYFALRKLHFMHKARALVAFPGGFGTLDELFEALTVIQTKTIEPLPVVLVGKQFWSKVIDFEYLALEGVISRSSLELFTVVETAQQAWQYIESWYNTRQIHI